jgi:hypothetical protein
MDANGRLYTQTILAPWSHVDALQQPDEAPTPQDIYFDRQFRKLARMLQRDLQETFDDVVYRSTASAAWNCVFKEVRRRRPRVSRRAAGLWGNRHFVMFMQGYNTSMMLLHVLCVLGKGTPRRCNDDDHVYWEIPEFEPKPEKGDKR